MTLSGKGLHGWSTERNHPPSCCAGVVATACTQSLLRKAGLEARNEPERQLGLAGLQRLRHHLIDTCGFERRVGRGLPK